MKKTLQRLTAQLGCLPYVLGATLIVALVVWWSIASRGNHVEAVVSDKIDVTPAQVQSIQRIGQWEFLSIADEELVDTVKHGIFGDSELIRIYYGTLRLGIDLQKAKPQWLTVKNDSIVTATLPPVELLDHNFIDEARTQSFFESGKWTEQDRQKLYERAYRKMLSRCLTKANVEAAEQNAKEQMAQLLRSMGFKQTEITIEHKHNNTKL